MPTTSPRKLSTTDTNAAHAAVLKLVRDGAICDAMQSTGSLSSSPAHALQQRLTQAYMQPTGGNVRDARLPIGIRVLTILGAGIALWVPLGAIAYLVV